MYKVVLREDNSCNMAVIQINGKTVYEGNYWDFHPGCHGYPHPKHWLFKDLSSDWNGRNSLVSEIVGILRSRGHEAESLTEEFDWHKSLEEDK